ncbi:MAG TPA: hypothetical protein DHV28_04645 [Ignavibacteriales bacterium]|nr:hypothetical protein [Ignavibacteriales bacterium]
MNEKLKRSTLKKISFFMILMVFSNFYSCDLNEQDKVFRRQITLETNLSTLKIGDLNGIRNLDTSTVYPYILEDIVSTSIYFYGTRIYPTQDTGFIKLNIYGGEGYNSQLSFKDSMTVYTPIDTIDIVINEYHFLRN